MGVLHWHTFCPVCCKWWNGSFYQSYLICPEVPKWQIKKICDGKLCFYEHFLGLSASKSDPCIPGGVFIHHYIPHIITSYTGFNLPLKSTKKDKFLPPASFACSAEGMDEWLSPYRQKLFAPLPHSSLMSTASSIDLLVDLKEIQSHSPRVAFFLLWEIKRLHCPCLSVLLVIISPSSPVVRAVFPLPWAPLTVSLLHVCFHAKHLFRLFYKLAFVVLIQMWAEWRTAAMQIISSEAGAGESEDGEGQWVSGSSATSSHKILDCRPAIVWMSDTWHFQAPPPKKERKSILYFIWNSRPWNLKC